MQYFFIFLRDRSNWSSPSFSSTTFQDFLGISDLLSEESKFRFRTKLYSKCNTSLVSSLNLSPIYRWKSLIVESCRGNPRFNFTCTSCIFFSLLLFKERGQTWKYFEPDFHARQVKSNFNRLTPNDLYTSRTAPLTSKRCILYIY